MPSGKEAQMASKTARGASGGGAARRSPTGARVAEARPSYMALLGLASDSVLVVREAIEEGLGYDAFIHFVEATSLPVAVASELTRIPARTLARRRLEGRLGPEESDRLVRAARVVGRAIELFENDVQAARQWLEAPQRALGGVAPLEFARTDVGARAVETLIGQTEHGIPA
ncbi:MAG: antitoxin Xre/MbcA/ParS toxin-binding domain-containing protein [Gemmatimonadales bacterium]